MLVHRDGLIGQMLHGSLPFHFTNDWGILQYENTKSAEVAVRFVVHTAAH